MDVITHDRKREQIDAKHGREELQAFLNPLAAIVKTFAGKLIGPTKISPPDDALADMKHADLIFINDQPPSQTSPN